MCCPIFSFYPFVNDYRFSKQWALKMLPIQIIICTLFCNSKIKRVLVRRNITVYLFCLQVYDKPM